MTVRAMLPCCHIPELTFLRLQTFVTSVISRFLHPYSSLTNGHPSPRTDVLYVIIGQCCLLRLALQRPYAQFVDGNSRNRPTMGERFLRNGAAGSLSSLSRLDSPSYLHFRRTTNILDQCRKLSRRFIPP